jgi:hypothetical protein
MRKFLPNFRFSWKTVPKFLDWAAVLIFLLINTKLFFTRSTATDKDAILVDSIRPFVYFGLILLVAAVCFFGLYRAYGIKKEKLPPASKRRALLKKLFCLLVGTAVILANAILCFNEMELVNNPTLPSMQDKYILVNCSITFVMFLILVFLTNSLSVGMILGNILFAVWGIVNYYVYTFRTIPLQWIDFGSIGTAAHVADRYDLTMTWQVVAVIVFSCCICGIYLHAGIFHILKKWPGKILMRVFCVAAAACFLHRAFQDGRFISNTGIYLWDWKPDIPPKMLIKWEVLTSFMRL